MPDFTDDWMHPNRAGSGNLAEHKREPERFLIQRQRVVICSFVGGGGPPKRWDTWSSHKTQEERDAELRRLREQHPAWHLRPARENEIGGYRRVDVEDEKDDLIARLLALNLKQRKSGSKAKRKPDPEAPALPRKRRG